MTGRALDDDLPVRRGDVVAEKYRVERLLGSGGMGSVFEATHLQLLQRVAIKFVRADSLDESSAIRLLREARAAVVLQSEHVARVFDVGTLPSGIAYLVMEYLDGETLASRLARSKRLSIEEATWVASQACKGLGEAHRRGIVHRDVKPANLILARTGDGRLALKLVDFGIAKVADPRVAVAPELTSSEHALGTPRYMSPEQLTASAHVDARTDVWALGVVFYECLVGETPFPRGTSFEVGARILAGAAPRVSDTLAVPPEVDALVARCLAREASARFADANELLLALEGIGIEARALLDDPASATALPSKENAATALGLGAREPSLPPTRVGPLAAPPPARTQRIDVPPPSHAAASPAANAVPIAPRDPTEPLPLRSPVRWATVVALVVLLLTAGAIVSVRARAERRDPDSLVPVPVSAEAATATASPAVTITAPAGTTPAVESSAIAEASAEKPPSRAPARRAPPRPPMTRPPNER